MARWQASCLPSGRSAGRLGQRFASRAADGLCCVQVGVDALEDLCTGRDHPLPINLRASLCQSIQAKDLPHNQETRNHKQEEKKKSEASTTNHNPTPQLFPDHSLPRHVPSRHHCLAPHRRHCRLPRLQDIHLQAPPTSPESRFFVISCHIIYPEEQKQRHRGSSSPPAKTRHQTPPQIPIINIPSDMTCQRVSPCIAYTYSTYTRTHARLPPAHEAHVATHSM